MNNPYEDYSEANLTDLALKDHTYAFRNDCGQGYQGGKKFNIKQDGAIPVKKGDLIVVNPAPVKYGLQVGSGDLVGWEPVKVTPELVGKTIAVFKSVEIKTIKDKIGRDQIIWYFNVRMSGGIAKILHCNKDLTLEEILAYPRRSEATGKIKDRIIDNLHEQFRKRRGLA